MVTSSISHHLETITGQAIRKCSSHGVHILVYNFSLYVGRASWHSG